MKCFIRIMVVAMALFILQPCAEAQNKQLERKTKNSYKTKMKEYDKGGWKIYGTSRTLEVSLLSHYDKLNKDGVTEISATTESYSKSVAQEKLLTDLCSRYAHECGVYVQGRIAQDLGNVTSSEEQEEFKHMYSAYEQLVSKEINGVLQYSYTVYRPIMKNGKEAYEFETFYLVDEEAATQARIRAFKNATAESAAAQKYAEKISDFVQEAFWSKDPKCKGGSCKLD